MSLSKLKQTDIVFGLNYELDGGGDLVLSDDNILMILNTQNEHIVAIDDFYKDNGTAVVDGDGFIENIKAQNAKNKLATMSVNYNALQADEIKSSITAFLTDYSATYDSMADVVADVAQGTAAAGVMDDLIAAYQGTYA